MHCILHNHHHYHHTVQVAYSFVWTLVNVLVLQGRTPPAQVAHVQCQDHLEHKFTAGCRIEMQVAQGHDLH